MNLIGKKISAFILSCIVLFSSMSFAIDEHFCGDQVMDVSYFGNADDCGMEEVDTNSNITILKANNCCKDEITHFESSLYSSEKPISIHNLASQYLFSNTHFNNGFNRIKTLRIQYYKDFSPPDIRQDFQVLHQTFLI